MKIILENADIEQALVDHVAAKGLDLKGKSVEVRLTAGRGPNGYTATVEIHDSPRDPVVEKTTEDGTEPADDKLVFE